MGMFYRRNYTVQEFALEIAGDSSGAPLDGLIQIVEKAQALANQENLSFEEPKSCMWAVEPWPDPSDAEHLVIRIFVEDGITRHQTR